MSLTGQESNTNLLQQMHLGSSGAPTPVASTTSVNTAVSFNVPTSSGHKKRRTDAEVRKPQIRDENFHLYRAGRKLMTNRVKWQCYLEHLQKYKSLNLLPSYCRINKTVPQMWSQVEDVSQWWNTKVSNLQAEMFEKIYHETQVKIDQLLKAEKDHLTKIGANFSPIESQEYLAALQKLESRTKDFKSKEYQQSLVRDMAGNSFRRRRPATRGREQSRSASRKRKNQGNNRNPSNKPNNRKRKFQDNTPRGNNFSDEDTAKIAEIVAAALKAAKRE